MTAVASYAAPRLGPRRAAVVNLHCHLAGALSPEALRRLAATQGMRLPAARPRPAGGSLPALLARIAERYPLLQRPAALASAATAVAADNAALGVRYLEVRVAPSLHTRAGLDVGSVLRAVLDGLDACDAVETGLVVSLVRGMDPAEARSVVAAAAALADRGVVGVDLAGDERRHPAAPYREALAAAAAAGLGVTVHAGETGSAANVVEAVEVLGATRVGHGIAALGDPSCLQVLRDRAVTCEVCPTSNAWTGAAASPAEGALDLWRAGIAVSVGDDDAGVLGTDVAAEWDRLAAAGMTGAEAAGIAAAGVHAAFCTDEARRGLAGTLPGAAPVPTSGGRP